MKKLMISFIAIFAIIAIGLVLVLIYAISQGSNGFSFEQSNASLVNTQNISLDEITSINISYQSDDIIFYTSDTDEIILKEYMNFTPDKNELASITTSGSEITIEGRRQNFQIFEFGMFTRNCRAELYLPAEYSNKLTVTTSSGNIDSDLTFTLSEFAATSSSGDIKMNEVNAASINATTSSGNITVQVAEGKRQFSSTSGDIKILGGHGDSNSTSSSGNITIENASGYIEADSSSGNIKINNSLGGGNLKTSSGNIKLELTDVTDNIDIKASSGDVSVMLPSTTSFDFTSETSSGDIRTFFDEKLSYNKKGNEASGSIGDNPDLSIHINTSSGNISINKE